MVSTIDEIAELLDLARSADEFVISDAKLFAESFPEAGIDDYVKCYKSLAKGIKVEKLIDRFRDFQFEIGQKKAKEEFKTVFMMKDCRDEMLYDLRNGKEKGSTTYIRKLDPAWTWRMNEFNLWTGYANEGKSLFLRFLALIKAIKDKWKFAFYAPEDFPAKEFFDDIIHTASGYSTDKDNDNFIDEKLYIKLVDLLDPYFYFVYIKPPDNSLINVFKKFVPLIKKHKVKVGVIDPLIKVQRPKEFMNADDKYAGYVTTLATDFSRQYKISLHLVMHQLTPKLQENGLYPAPTYYSIKGGGTWADGSDNVNSLQRPQYARDKIDDEVVFASMKIKKQKLVGIPQNVRFRFNRKTNRYVDYDNKKDIFNFKEALTLAQSKPGKLF